LNLVVFAWFRSQKVRQATLLVSSYAIYTSWGGWFAAVLFSSTVMNFLLGEWVRRNPNKVALWTGIVLNLALLSSFKYLPGAVASSSLPFLQRLSHLVLP